MKDRRNLKNINICIAIVPTTVRTVISPRTKIAPLCALCFVLLDVSNGHKKVDFFPPAKDGVNSVS